MSCSKKIVILFALCISHVFAEDLKPAITSPIPINEIQNYSHYSVNVKKLITEAEKLSKQHLTYQFGSDNPQNKGMDCSGTIYYLLKTMNVENIPRDSEGMYQWVKKSGHFHSVSSQNFSSSDYSQLKPGDLLFWEGTYHKNNSASISHVMLYLGKTKQNKPIMFGSSDGRTYLGKKMWGVSVFDFELPSRDSSAKFVGYSCIPTLTCEE